MQKESKNLKSGKPTKGWCMDLQSFWIDNSIAAFLVSCVFAGLLIPKIVLIAFRKNLFDEQDGRKIHHSTVPRLGGIAFGPVILFCFSILLFVNLLSGGTRILEAFRVDVLQLSALACSLILMYLIGIADDLIGVKYRAKFVFQLACGVLFLLAELSVTDMEGLFFLNELPKWVAYPMSVILFVFIVNAINLIDGIDGLASGLSSIALGFYGVIFLYAEEYSYALLAFATLGTVVPFFYYNVFGKVEKQQKIFMGDTGSLTIGTILCYLSIHLSNLDEAQVGSHPLVLAFAPLLVPCMDVVRVFFHRLRNGKSPFLPDQNHIHHKLLKLGMTQRKAMICILFFSSLCVCACVWLSFYVNATFILLGCVLFFTLINCWMTKKIGARQTGK